jgi:hypothetical protein
LEKPHFRLIGLVNMWNDGDKSAEAASVSQWFRMRFEAALERWVRKMVGKVGSKDGWEGGFEQPSATHPYFTNKETPSFLKTRLVLAPPAYASTNEYHSHP